MLRICTVIDDQYQLVQATRKSFILFSCFGFLIIVLNAVTMGADFNVGLYKEIQSHEGVYGNVV